MLSYIPTIPNFIEVGAKQATEFNNVEGDGNVQKKYKEEYCNLFTPCQSNVRALHASDDPKEK